MEYGSKNNIFGLKMMVKSSEKIRRFWIQKERNLVLDKWKLERFIWRQDLNFNRINDHVSESEKGRKKSLANVFTYFKTPPEKIVNNHETEILKIGTMCARLYYIFIHSCGRSISVVVKQDSQSWVRSRHTINKDDFLFDKKKY